MTLRLWSWPMKCQRKLRVRRGLGLEVLGAVLAEQRRARPRRASPSSSSGTYLTAARSSTSAGRGRARRARSRSHALGRAHARGVEAGDQARHTTPAWRPVTPPSRRWEKNSAEPAHRAQADVVDRRRRRRRRAGAARSPRGRGCARRRARRSARTRRGPPRRPRSSSRAAPGPISARDRAVAAELAQRGDALGDDPAASPRQPPCSAATAPSATSSTGRQSATNTSAGWPRRARSPGRPPRVTAVPGRRLGGAPHGRAVDLAAVEEALARRSRPPRRAGRGSRRRSRRVVGGQPAEVERGERRLARRRRGGSRTAPRAPGSVGGDVLAVPAERACGAWAMPSRVRC